MEIMKRLLVIVFLFQQITALAEFYEAKRLPADKEIKEAYERFIEKLDSTAGSNYMAEYHGISKPIKYHKYRNTLGAPDYGRSYVVVIVDYKFGRSIEVPLHDFSDERGNFRYWAFRVYGAPRQYRVPLDEAVAKKLASIKDNPDLKLGFPESSQNEKSEGSEGDSELPWEVIIGIMGAGGAAALARKIFKKKPRQKAKSNNENKDEKKEKEQLKYILNLNK